MVCLQDKDHTIWIGTDNGLMKYNQLTKRAQAYLTSADEKAFHGEYGIFGVAEAEIEDTKRYLW